MEGYIEIPELISRSAGITVPVYMDERTYRYVSYEHGHPFLTTGPAAEDFKDFLERISGQFNSDYSEDPEMETSDERRGDYLGSFSVRASCASWAKERFYWKVDVHEGRPTLTIWK